MCTKTSASVFILFLLPLLLAWRTENWKLFGYYLLVATPLSIYSLYASNKEDSTQTQSQSTEFQTEGYDDIDGPVFRDNEKVSKKPGYIFVQQKIDSDGTPTGNYKIDVRSEQDQKPPKVVDCGSFSLKLVPRSCYHVVCIIKTTEAMSTKLSEYSNDNEGDGWYTLTTQEDFNKFMVVYNDTASRVYRKIV